MTDALFEFEPAPYTVPTLTEVLARDNGLTAVSTFSGCGGSSTGLHMAGWRIPYAVEFVPAAADTYAANFPDTLVDRRDIRAIDPADILNATGLDTGELDLLEGSPPCSSFSVANNRAENRFGQAKNKLYSEGIYQVTDDLFDEWLRLVDGLRPRTILAENVPGLLHDEAADYYRTILTRLSDYGYIVDSAVYNAMHFGAATSRRRLIIRGIRRDLGRRMPPRPRRRVGHGAALRDALASLPVTIPDVELEHADSSNYAIGEEWRTLAFGESGERYHQVIRCNPNSAIPSITVVGGHGGGANPMHPYECRVFTPTELAWIFGYPSDFTWLGTPGQRYERIARSVAPPLYAAHGAALRDALAPAREAA